MTVMGPGISGSYGAPQQPSQTEQEVSAWALVNKAFLGLVPDSLEVPFSQLGGNIWKYQSDASRPTLMPLGLTRTDVPDEKSVDDSWKGPFEELLGKIHPQLRERLTADMKLPFEARNPNYASLENMLKMIAKGMAWLEEAQKPIPPDSPKMERIIHNQALAGKALIGATTQSKELLTFADNYLEYAGTNHPHFDTLMFYSKQGKVLQQQFNVLLEQLKNPQAAPPAQKTLLNFAEKADLLNFAYGKIYRGNDLQILGPMYEAMAAVAAALSLTPASPTLFLGAKIATQGLFHTNSKAGLFGVELQVILKALSKGLSSTLLNQLGSAQLEMIMMMLMGLLAGSITTASLVSEFGIGRFPAENEGEEQEGRAFEFKLFIKMLAGSEILKTVHKVILQTCGSTERAQELTATIMETIDLLIMSLASVKGTPTNLNALLQNIKSYVGDNFKDIEAFLLKAIGEGVNDIASAKDIDVALKQGIISINLENFEGLYNACSNLLDLLGSSPEMLHEELEEMKQLALTIRQASSAENLDSARMITGLIRAA